MLLLALASELLLMLLGEACSRLCAAWRSKMLHQKLTGCQPPVRVAVLHLQEQPVPTSCWQQFAGVYLHSNTSEPSVHHEYCIFCKFCIQNRISLCAHISKTKLRSSAKDSMTSVLHLEKQHCTDAADDMPCTGSHKLLHENCLSGLTYRLVLLLALRIPKGSSALSLLPAHQGTSVRGMEFWYGFCHNFLFASLVFGREPACRRSQQCLAQQSLKLKRNAKLPNV